MVSTENATLDLPRPQAHVLRPYQVAAVEGLLRAIVERARKIAAGTPAAEVGHPLLVLPTGSGKTVVFVRLLSRARMIWSMGLRPIRAVVVAPRRELVAQAFDKLAGEGGAESLGVVCAALGRREWDAETVVASIDSIYSDAERLGRRDIVILDEAHLVQGDAILDGYPPRGSSKMRRLLYALRKQSARMAVIGCTATPWRLDGGAIYGPGKLFADPPIAPISMLELIAQGYLCPVSSVGAVAELKVDGVKRRAGDFVVGALERAVEGDPTERALDEVIERGKDCKTWLLFGVSVLHALAMRDYLRSRGVDAETITGETPAAEREGILRRFRAGTLRAVTNVETCTTGVDVPRIDLIACLRPTESAGLWCQMVGRGTRVADDKTDLLVLDFGGNAETHGPIDKIDPMALKTQERGMRAERAKAKTCPRCRVVAPLDATVCGCGYEWPIRTAQLASRASRASIVGGGLPEWESVRGVKVAAHEKRGAAEGHPPTLQVTYVTDAGVAFEWVCLEHWRCEDHRQRWACDQALRWWADVVGTYCPRTILEALAVPDLAQKIRDRVEKVCVRRGDGPPMVETRMGRARARTR